MGLLGLRSFYFLAKSLLVVFALLFFVAVFRAFCETVYVQCNKNISFSVKLKHFIFYPSTFLACLFLTKPSLSSPF